MAVSTARRSPNRLLLAGCSTQNGAPLGTDECTLLTDARERVIAVLYLPPALALEVCEYIALVRRENGTGGTLHAHTVAHSYVVAEPDTFKEITA